MGDVCEEVSGNNGNVKGLPILTISAANGWMNQKDRFSQVIAGNELKKYTLLKKGHLAYNHGNSKQAKYGTVFVQNLYDQALVPRVYHSFKMKTENNPYYVEYYFATKKLDRELARLVTSGARMDGLLNINKKDFFKIKFEVPTPVEQSLISTILQKLDQTITLHEEKKRQLDRLKSALLQKMFADKSGYPAVRFEGFSNEWEQRKLGEITDVRDGTHASPHYVNSGFPLLTSKNISNGCINYHEVNYISEYDFHLINERSKVDVNDILMGMIGTIGNLALVQEKPNFAIKNVALIKNTGSIDYRFLFQNLQTDYIERELSDNMDGGTQKFMSLKKIRNLSITFPTLLNEQDKIGNLFHFLDSTITLYNQKLSLLKRVKQTLLQKMFI